MNTKQENIRYNYYGIECANIVNYVDDTTVLRKLSSSFRGKVNNPNIIYSKNNSIINYQATDIYICGKNHVTSNKYDGEIVILHKPTTLSLKLYSCFPYVKSSPKSKEDGFDKLINSSSNSLSNLYQDFPISIEINKCINPNPSVTEYKTVDRNGEECVVLYFDNVINITSDLDGKILENAPFMIRTNKPEVSVLEDKLKSPSILMEGFHETMIDDKKTDNSDVIYKCEYLPVDTEDMVQVLQVPIGTPAYHYDVGKQISGLFISTTVFMFAILLIFFVSPMLYGFIESLFISKIFLDNIVFIKFYTNIDVNLLNLILILSIIATTIILLIYGLIAGDVVAISISLFLPFFTLISYVGITFFRKPKIVNNTL
jgi:hypothetical protein